MNLILLVLAILAAAPVNAASTPAMGFDDALRKILDRSTAIATQRARVEQTIAQNLSTRFYLLPTVDISLTQSRIVQEGLDPFSSRQAALSGSINLFRFGGDYLARISAKDQEDEQRALLDSAALSTEAQAVRALVGWISSKREVSIIRQIRESQMESHHIMRERYQRGLSPEQEVSKLTVDLDNSAADVANAEIRFFEARGALLDLLGEEEIKDSWVWRDKLIASNPKGVSPSALTARPDWRAAEARLNSAENAKASALRTLLPSLDATGSWVLFNQRRPEGQALTGTTAMITLSLPIFDRLTGWGRFRSQAQAQAAADAGLEQVRRTARSEWESSRFSFETALSTALAREKTVSVAQRLFQDGLRRFRSGKATANELAIDRDRELRSQLLSVQGWASAHVEFARYCHAQGKSVFSCP
jgi:outer membrane protein TolC